MAAPSWDVAPDAAPLRFAAQVKRKPLGNSLQEKSCVLEVKP